MYHEERDAHRDCCGRLNRNYGVHSVTSKPICTTIVIFLCFVVHTIASRSPPIYDYQQLKKGPGMHE